MGPTSAFGRMHCDVVAKGRARKSTRSQTADASQNALVDESGTDGAALSRREGGSRQTTAYYFHRGRSLKPRLHHAQRSRQAFDSQPPGASAGRPGRTGRNFRRLIVAARCDPAVSMRRVHRLHSRDRGAGSLRRHHAQRSAGSIEPRARCNRREMVDDAGALRQLRRPRPARTARRCATRSRK